MKISKRIELNTEDLNDIEHFEKLLKNICHVSEKGCEDCTLSNLCRDALKNIIIDNFDDLVFKVSAAPEK